MSKLHQCACGSTVFIRTVPVRGLWTEILTVQENGKIKVEGCGDDVRNIGVPKTVYCDQCKKRHPNPDA